MCRSFRLGIRRHIHFRGRNGGSISAFLPLHCCLFQSPQPLSRCRITPRHFTKLANGCNIHIMLYHTFFRTVRQAKTPYLRRYLTERTVLRQILRHIIHCMRFHYISHVSQPQYKPRMQFLASVNIVLAEFRARILGDRIFFLCKIAKKGQIEDCIRQ